MEGDKLKFGRHRGFPGTRFCWGGALDLVLGRSGESVEAADASELKKRTHMVAGALHRGRKGEGSDAWELLIVEEIGAGRSLRVPWRQRQPVARQGRAVALQATGEARAGRGDCGWADPVAQCRF
jgi:hypothetical protein